MLHCNLCFNKTISRFIDTVFPMEWLLGIIYLTSLSVFDNQHYINYFELSIYKTNDHMYKY